MSVGSSSRSFSSDSRTLTESFTLPAFSSITARLTQQRRMLWMLIECRRKQREPRIDLAVIGYQIRLGHIELEAALRMLRRYSRRSSPAPHRAASFPAESTPPECAADGERGIDQALIARESRVGVPIQLRDIRETQKRRIRRFVARGELCKAALRFIVIPALVRKQRQAAIDVALVGIGTAQPLEFEPRFFEPIERDENLGHFELSALGIELRDLAGRG